ncbi:dicarboxylate/amino acid:cation symporter [Paenibacillus polymyxa]|uniref:dicarboxylate/amino acid:cation symporter n=1 Tax=Paenibacillus polymyxa TaxID=1406 RepID=UPI002AB5D402|nr:dicarboxylate/amino acid:cation symporter [Paenibacillus polymyxa]MDY8023285.1 dicarboxylate/amino acid:cation symporter [Paenibacillus polymyxa]
MQVLKNYKFSIILLAGVLLGAIAGTIMGEKSAVLQPFADVFLNMVFVIIVPLVFVSIAGSIASMTNLKKLGKILGIFFLVMVVTGIITAVLALITGLIFNPALNAEVSFGEAVQEQAAASLDIVGLITVSDFVELLSLKHMMALIVFAILFGISVSSIGEEGAPVSKLLSSLASVLNKIVSIVMYYAPVGIACYFATLIGKVGNQIVWSVARASIIYVVFCILFFILFSFLATYFGGGKTGIKRFWKNIWLPLTTAMGTCSSTACIPVNRLAVKQMDIPDEIGDIIVPLGANMHKNGVVAVQMIKIIFLFGIFNMTMGTGDMVKAVLVALISGIIVGTIPSGGFIGELFICTAFGFPMEAVPILVILGTITDPFCTMVNVTGDPAISMVISRIIEGKNWIKQKIGAVTES